jgi:hypothetical protein
MELEQIKLLVLKETPNIQPTLRQIRRAIEMHPNGADIYVPARLVALVEKHCDANKIPLYVVAKDCVSVAASYVALLDREEQR